MFKQQGAPCPSCNAHPCAEHRQMNQPMRWTCNHCGASGEIAGQTAKTKATALPHKR